jgi:hypothetical protein
MHGLHQLLVDTAEQGAASTVVFGSSPLEDNWNDKKAY